MEFNPDLAVRALAALAQETRLGIFRLLVQAGPEGLVVGRIAELIGIPAATLSFHLKALAQGGLVTSRQEGRFVRYVADFEAMHGLIGYLSESCCGGQPCAPSTCAPSPSRPGEKSMTDRVLNVLFLCTGNSARSILAESILNAMGKGRFRAYSAGSHPAGQVNPFALELIRKNRLPTEGLRSKSWDEFARSEANPDAPELDFVFTVCDNAAGEVCPVWPGQPMTAHWGVPDPAAVQGSDEDKRRAFFSTWTEMSNRISIFVSLPMDKLDRLSLQKRLDAIGQARAESEAA